jgi:hypothetical protein
MHLHVFNRNNQPVSPSWQSLHVARTFRLITEGLPEPLNRIIQAHVEIYERVRGPKPLAKFLAGNHFAGPLDQKGQNLEGLVLQLNLQTMLAKLARVQICLERSEAYSTLLGGYLHIQRKAEEAYHFLRF